MFYGITREDIQHNYTWEDIQFRVNQIPINKMITINPGMKKFDIDEAYRFTLMDKREVDINEQRLEYDNFMERLKKAKTGGK